MLFGPTRTNYGSRHQKRGEAAGGSIWGGNRSRRRTCPSRLGTSDGHRGKSSDLRKKGKSGEPSSTSGAGRAKTLFILRTRGTKSPGSTSPGRPFGKRRKNPVGEGSPPSSSNGMHWRFPDSGSDSTLSSIADCSTSSPTRSVPCTSGSCAPSWSPAEHTGCSASASWSRGIGGRVGSHRMRFARHLRGVGRSPRSGKRVLRRTWDRKVAGRGSHRSHGNERRRKRHGSHRGVQRRGVCDRDHPAGARAEDSALGGGRGGRAGPGLG